ncbi:MAG: box helicase, partial [Myxococcaceae bacterium]|nr:box helicase [Myxococcaceae bacterium]
EVLSNMALREGAAADVGYVIMDEFHYYADRDRGVAWQVPLLTLPNATFLLMSATIGDTKRFEEALNKLTKKETVVVRSSDRPVPLDFEYRETPLHETVADLVRLGKAPVYIVAFTQRACAEEAQNLMSTDFSTKEEKKAISHAIGAMRFDSPYGKDVQKYVKHGVGIHHAGLLPKYRLLVEKLAQRGLLKVICGTDTLGVGVNIPIRTVLFTKLCKFDGQNTKILSVRDFQQISGRAGRKGFDIQGSVVVQAPEHVIENLRLEAKSGSDGKKRKFVRKKPPDRGYVPWDRVTFNRLVTSAPEPLESRFQVTHGMLLNVLEREGGGCRAMARLIRDSHERTPEKRIHGKTAMMMFKSLLDAGIIEIEAGRARVSLDLQEDFSLNQTLSLYLLETLPLLDEAHKREDEGTERTDDATGGDGAYALDLLTLVESILENPELVLMKQLDALKTAKMAEMKGNGVEFDDRIAELDKMEYPKPNKDFIYDTFNAFARKHPWVGTENIRPKSIARDMYEKFLSFGEYVREYGLERAEGLLLRYLSDVYKTLVQTVPAYAKDDAVDEITTYFGAIVRQVDSSLLDEWEAIRSGVDRWKLHKPDVAGTEVVVEPEGSRDITKDMKGFRVLVQNEVFRLVRALSRKDWDAAAELVNASAATPADVKWSSAKLAEAMAPYFTEHAALLTDQKARSPKHTRIEQGQEGESTLYVERVLVDPEDTNDWLLELRIDLPTSRDAGRPLLDLRRIST